MRAGERIYADAGPAAHVAIGEAASARPLAVGELHITESSEISTLSISIGLPLDVRSFTNSQTRSECGRQQLISSLVLHVRRKRRSAQDVYLLNVKSLRILAHGSCAQQHLAVFRFLDT